MLGDRTGVAFTRRQGLVAASLLVPAALLTACSSSDSPEPDPYPDPATLASRVAQQEYELVALYTAVIARHPVLAPSISAIANQHRAHATTLDPQVSDASPTPSVPDSADEAIVKLIAAERRAATMRIDACVEAEQSGLARTLAFIAASEGSHVPALRDLRS